jgi:hypothetical protein
MPQNWVILCLVHAEDKDTKVYANQFIDELCQTPSAAHLRLFCLRNTYLFDNELNMDANLFELVFDNQKGYRVLKGVKPFGKINLGDATQLSKILDVVKDALPDNKFILMTWDHGYAFGVFNGKAGDSFLNISTNFTETNHTVTGNTLWKLKKTLTSDASNNDFLISKVESFKNAREDIFNQINTANLFDLVVQSETDMLLPEEISLAISKSFDTKKVDLIIMMNCWMQSIDTIYALKDTANIIIAPQTTIDFIGYDYYSLISKIVTTPDITVSDLASEIIKGTREKYKKRNTQIAFNEVVISAIRLIPQNISSLKNIINNIAGELTSALNNNAKFELVRINRSKTYEFTRPYLILQPPALKFYYMVDLVNVIELLENVQILENFAKQITDWLLNADNLIKKEVGRNFVDATGKEIACAMTIYFPNNKEYTLTSTYYHTFYKMPSGHPEKLKAFARDSKWSSFIKIFNDKL